MKEEIENAREETILKNEQMNVIESRYESAINEVSPCNFSNCLTVAFLLQKPKC
jgi:hypothetical protein